MRSLYALSRRNKSPCDNRTEVNIPKNKILKKKISILTQDKTNYYHPSKIYLDKRSFPYRSFIGIASNMNHQNEKEKNAPYYHNCEKNRPLPLVTRQDLIKYLKQNKKLIKRKRFCISCEKINEENSKNEYLTIETKNFPVINGRAFGNKFKIVHNHKTISNPRNQERCLKNKLIICKTDDKNKMINILHNSSDISQIEERKNERKEKYDKLNEVDKNNNERLKQISANNTKTVFNFPKQRTNFHKIQIFNHCKPFLVD